MKITNYTVNKIGLDEIKQFLAENHKNGGAMDEGMLLAWAAEAEDHLRDGNGAFIEVREWDSVWGHAQMFEISDAGVDVGDENS